MVTLTLHASRTVTPHLPVQLKPVVGFTWDLLLLSEDTPGFEAQAFGITDVAPASECKDSTCLGIKNGTYLQLPAQNFGQYASISFSFWFCPGKSSQNNTDAMIMHFSRNNGQDSIEVSRKGSSNDILFVVRNAESALVSRAVASGHWQMGVWKHVVWTMGPLPSGTNMVWEIFIDGAWLLRQASGFPVDAEMTENYLGRGYAGGEFEGHLDSFFMYQKALSSGQVAALHAVRCAWKYVSLVHTLFTL
jgi:hypothetical protein